MLKYLIAAFLLVLGIIFLYLAVRRKKRKIFYIKEEKDPLKMEGKTPDELLRSITNVLKTQIKHHYKISDKLSLKEIIKELEKKENPFFLDTAKSLEIFFYTDKKPKKENLIKIKKHLLEEIKRKELFDRKQKEEKDIGLKEKIFQKEKELKEKLKIEKIRFKKLKRNSKSS